MMDDVLMMYDVDVFGRCSYVCGLLSCWALGRQVLYDGILDA